MGQNDPKVHSRRALCQVIGCTKFAQTRGHCKAHGGGTRCKVDSCTKLAQSRGHCIAHGGGRRCHVPQCEKLAQSKGYCIAHGGGRKCAVDGCEKFSQIKGKCKAHAKIAHSPPPARKPAPSHVALPLPLPPLLFAQLSPLQPTTISTISLSPLREYVRRPEPTHCSFAALFHP
ncbi:hypothetical protein THRCLA_22280 [Thraustotheca clavata]|uniref:WRKY19-like zinc finger domain-containing protein n=1 Tax=Thraustotheca clavata TaxID=74557 RepID=A0A1V9Z7E4_9STRA|nr:hypothetical protein THRCLA_22280 [Thraustotheca clavata]